MIAAAIVGLALCAAVFALIGAGWFMAPRARFIPAFLALPNTLLVVHWARVLLA